METLRLVDVTDEGHLVLMSGDGRRFELPVDAEVRSAVRRDRVAAPPSRIDRPGPREVQARIRAGADAESVAEATGLELTYVQRFEGPALAERRHVADLARLSQVHRDPGARQITLDAAVLAALADSGVDGAALTWDSRRVEGSRWDVVLLLPATAGHGEGALEATWRFDVATRSLEEIDEAARRLTRLEQRKLSPVRDRVFDIEAGRAATVKARRAAAASSPQTSSTAALLEELAQQRGRRPQSVAGRTPGPDGPDPGDERALTGLGGDVDRGAVPVPIGSGSARLHRQGAGSTAHRATEQHPAGKARGPVRAVTVDPPPPAETMVPGATPEAPAAPEPGVDRVRSEADGPDRQQGAHEDDGAIDVGSGELLIDPELLAPLDLGVEPVSPTRRPAGARRPPAARSSQSTARSPVPTPAAAPARAGASAVSGSEAVPAVRTARKRRAGVPSWDDIVFGARHDGEE